MTPVRKVRADAHGAWACYAETGGMCHKTRMPGRVCPCDGWTPFLRAWYLLADAIDEDDSLVVRPPPVETCIADLLETCINLAGIEYEISDDEYERLKTWLAEWRAS